MEEGLCRQVGTFGLVDGEVELRSEARFEEVIGAVVDDMSADCLCCGFC